LPSTFWLIKSGRGVLGPFRSQVVEREQTLRTKSQRSLNAKQLRAERSKSSVERRQRYLLATAKLDADGDVYARGKNVVVMGPGA
jgi:hypothetical protein